MTGMNTVRIERITPEHPQFEEWATVFVTAGGRQWGRDTTAYPPNELAQMWESLAHAKVWLAAIDDDGDVVGSAAIGMPTQDNPHLAGFDVACLDERATALKQRLVDEVERVCREAGRTTLMIETQTPVGAANDEAAFFEAAGYAEAQTCVRNGQRLPVSADIGAEMRRVIEMNDGYRIETVVGRLPEDWLPERARLAGMMSTDTPLGDLAIEPENWTTERVTAMFDEDERRGRVVVEAVAWHEETGEMAAFTHVSVPAETPWIAYQDDTLVAKAHRGHRLGYRVKAAVSLALPQAAPGVTVQRTWNDETNEHMLRINRELGYEREGTLVEWQKVLDSAPGDAAHDA